MLKENQRIQSTIEGITRRYTSEEEHGLGLPASLAQFDPKSQQFVAAKFESKIKDIEKISQRQAVVTEEEQKFIQALRDYEKDAKPKYRTGVKIDEIHTLADVWEMLDTAVDDYEKGKKAGVWGRVRKAFGGLGENGAAVEQWLGLLPTESQYMSVVCGGIKLILKAAERMKSIQEATLSGLHDIPVLLNGAQRVLGIYRSSQRLIDLSDALYAATLTTLGHLLHYISRKSTKRAIEALFKQSSFEEDLMGKLGDMRKCRDAFNEEARICALEMQESCESMLQETSSGTRDIKEEIDSMKVFMLLTHKEQIRSQQFLREEALWARESNKRKEERDESMLFILNELYGALKSMPLVIREAWARNQPYDAAYVPLMCLSANAPEATGQKYTQSDLHHIILSRLDFNAKRIQLDVEENYEHGYTLLLSEQDCCVYALSSSDLASWITSPASRILVINGNMDSAQLHSPLSFLSARLVYTLDLLRERNSKGKHQVAAVHFFCGEHTDREDTMNSATAIINNLLAQLLSSFKDTNLERLVALGDFENNSLDDVLRRFKTALKLLHSTAVVFCIVDNLPFYLFSEQTSEHTQILVRCLIRLAHRQRKLQEKSGQGCTFKLLLTAPMQFMGSEFSLLKDDEVMNMPVPVPQSGGFTNMKWELDVGSEVARIA
ncbi:uncharacterized protein N7511_005226 [Penicillium nucicola]|uniref:uncharacterized protein n=1 Tax=Penicillium nucicola TaxID=1850975 RepID=UPI0025455131|nr:uncharacterized protein N7511_005226 [Penicillium nucicola]KAJ5761844.1 hypothetical protein N7511_005226 [Penicillium nucicola]